MSRNGSLYPLYYAEIATLSFKLFNKLSHVVTLVADTLPDLRLSVDCWHIKDGCYKSVHTVSPYFFACCTLPWAKGFIPLQGAGWTSLNEYWSKLFRIFYKWMLTMSGKDCYYERKSFWGILFHHVIRCEHRFVEQLAVEKWNGCVQYLHLNWWRVWGLVENWLASPVDETGGSRCFLILVVV